MAMEKHRRRALGEEATPSEADVAEPETVADFVTIVAGSRAAGPDQPWQRGKMASTSPRRFVIIGNGIAGTTAAEQIRKADADASIILITNEPYSLYNRIALPP